MQKLIRDTQAYTRDVNMKITSGQIQSAEVGELLNTCGGRREILRLPSTFT